MFNLHGPMKRIVSVAGLALLLLLVFSFSRRIAEYTRLTGQEDIEASRIQQLQLTESYLDEQITFNTSEAAVEEWAREQARMAQEGDFPVIPLSPNQATNGQEIESNSAEESPINNLQEWLDWLFFAGP